MFLGLGYSNFRGALFWKAVNACADRGESDALDLEFDCEVQDARIAGRQKSVFIRLSAAPDRTNGVDDVFAIEIVTLGEFGVAGLAAAEAAALLEQAGAGGAMNGAIYAASAEKGTVGGIDDGVDVLFGDVALNDKDFTGHRGLRTPQRFRERHSSVNSGPPRA